jgi:hypothetical protein
MQPEPGAPVNDSTIPYAAPTPRIGITGPELFGAAVRTVGLLITMYGLYTAAYSVIIEQFNAPAAGQSSAMFIYVGCFWMAIGVALLRGRWLVRFAYGRSEV